MANWLLDSIQDSGNNPIELHPRQGFLENEPGRRTSHKMLGGNQQITYWPTRKSWALPVTWVTSADAFRIHGWWEDGHTLSWTLNNSVNPSTYRVNIANQERPLNQYQQVNHNSLQGVLMLETLDDSAATTLGTFVLDDDVFGLLDTDGNLLG